MRTWIVIFALALGVLGARAETPSDHAESIPFPSETPTGTAKPLPPRERLARELWGIRLGTQALDELVKLLQKPAELSSPEKFAAALDKFPKGFLTPEQRQKLLEWFGAGFVKSAPLEKRVDDIAFAAKKVQAESRAMLSSGPSSAGAPGAMPAGGLAQFQQMIQSQLGELQKKVDQALWQRSPSPQPGRESSEILDKLLADAQKPAGRGKPDAKPVPEPTPPETHKAKSKDDEDSKKYPERDGLRPPPRDERADRGGPPFNGNGGNNGGGGNGESKGEKKDEKNQGSPFGSGKGSKDDMTPLKKPTKAPTPTPFPTPTEMPEDAAAETAPAPPVKVSDLPLTSSPARGGAYNPPPFFGGGPGGFGAPGGGGGNMGAMLSGDPPQVGFQELMAGEGGSVRPVIVGYAGGGGPEEGGTEAPGNPDEAPVREGVSRTLRPQILEVKPGDSGRHWVFDPAGTMVTQLVCEGIDADKVALCSTLKFRAKLRKLKAVKAPTSEDVQMVKSNSFLPALGGL